MSTVTTRRTARVATPARWQAALRRAIENGVQVFQVASSGQWVATSTSKPGIVHETDGTSCTCEAAIFGSDPVCQHRAVYWNRQGMLDLDPTPEEVAAAAVIVPADVTVIVLDEPTVCCTTCEDTGAIVTASTINPERTYRRPCPDCRAKGAVPTMSFRRRQPAIAAPIAA